MLFFESGEGNFNGEINVKAVNRIMDWKNISIY